MLTEPEKFEINVNGLNCTVIRLSEDSNVYRLKTAHGTYLLAKDFYNVWVELTRTTGSAEISLSAVGKQIDEHCNAGQAEVGI